MNQNNSHVAKIEMTNYIERNKLIMRENNILSASSLNDSNDWNQNKRISLLSKYHYDECSKHVYQQEEDK